MVVMVSVGVPRRLQLAQADRPAQLTTQQADQVGPAIEALVVGIAVVTIHNRGELSAINLLEQIAQNATPVAHAWFFFFLSLDNPKEAVTPLEPSMHRDTSNHSPDSPARRWETGGKRHRRTKS